MSFAVWFEEAWRAGAIAADYRYDAEPVARAAWDAAIDAAAAALDKREEEAASAHTMVPEILALKA